MRTSVPATRNSSVHYFCCTFTANAIDQLLHKQAFWQYRSFRIFDVSGTHEGNALVNPCLWRTGITGTIIRILQPVSRILITDLSCITDGKVLFGSRRIKNHNRFCIAVPEHDIGTCPTVS
jgi:hypothetical protein